jgi:hypothetical protein
MGIEQIQTTKIKALLPASKFNWSQMESNHGNPYSIAGLFSKESCPWPKPWGVKSDMSYQGVEPDDRWRRVQSFRFVG